MGDNLQGYTRSPFARLREFYSLLLLGGSQGEKTTARKREKEREEEKDRPAGEIRCRAETDRAVTLALNLRKCFAVARLSPCFSRRCISVYKPSRWFLTEIRAPGGAC